MARSLNTVCLFVVISAVLVSSTQATVVVYTDRAAWQAAVLAVTTGHVHEQYFDGIPAGGLSTGPNDFMPLVVTISGAPGLNAIDDSVTADPFSDALSPNGSTYYLGDVDFTASLEPTLSFFDYPGYEVIGFGADWVIQGVVLSAEIQGTTISLNTYLPGGSGFLGIVTDQSEETLVVNISGIGNFGMDDVHTGNIFAPEPSTVCLFGSGLLGLLCIARRRAAKSRQQSAAFGSWFNSEASSFTSAAEENSSSD